MSQGKLRRLAELSDTELDEMIRRQLQEAPTTKKHEQLSLQMIDIINRIRLRAFGCDHQGNFLGTKKLFEDYKKVEILEEPLVLDPLEISIQLSGFAQDLKIVHGQYDQLDPKKYPWVTKGKHLSLMTAEKHIELHNAIPSRIGMIAEYVRESFIVPLAYHYVYTDMPWSEEGEDDPVPQYNGRKILTTSGQINYYRKNQHNIMHIARTGVIESITADMKTKLEKWGSAVPAELANNSFRRIGLNTWMKRVTTGLAEKLNKALILVNIARLQRPDIPMDSAMPNAASWGANRMFYDMNRVRTENPKIQLNGKTFAEAYLHIHGNTPEAALNIFDAPDEVINAKSGNLDYLKERVEMLNQVFERRMNERLDL